LSFGSLGTNQTDGVGRLTGIQRRQMFGWRKRFPPSPVDVLAESDAKGNGIPTLSSAMNAATNQTP